MNETLVQKLTTVPSGVPGLDLVHFPEWYESDGLPIAGTWSVTISANNIAAQRCGFRTFHLAMHYAARIADMADWTTADAELMKGPDGPALSQALRHAEAHAHEVDAAPPFGSILPFSNGPSLVEEGDDMRKFLSGAPSVEWVKDEESVHRCKVCGDEPKVRYDWMDG